MNKERLDLYLLNHNFVPSRSKASELINNGNVKVNDKVILKPSFQVCDEDNILILKNDVLDYVSRGGLKLKKAIDSFFIDLNNKILLDIGASTGGFTDCALKHGAKKVYSLDVGTNQLHPSLKANPKVISIENTNFKDVDQSMFDEKIDLYVCDVSFISIQIILKKLKELDDNFTIMLLFKPQFEVGKNNLNKNGVVKNKKILYESLIKFNDFLNSLNIGIINVTYSPICGQKEGNIEFLFYLKNNQKSQYFDYLKIINEAIEVLKVK